MIDIRLNTLGRVAQGKDCGFFIPLIDDEENTGGYLIFRCKNRDFEGEAFDDWVENWESLQSYFVSSNWVIEWMESRYIPMGRGELTAYLRSLDNIQTVALSSVIMYEVTISARGAYETGTGEVLDGPELRRWNEHMHQVASMCMNALIENELEVTRERLLNFYFFPKENPGSASDEEMAKNIDRAIARMRTRPHP